jgi:3-phosphoshikimate 1-carboxyvinyltransferase
MEVVVSGRRSLKGEIHVPGDKSISHRAVILGSIAAGTSRIRGLSSARDVESSVSAMKTLGVGIACDAGGAVVEGRGIEGFEHLGRKGPFAVDCGNSGTTARLLAGVLSGAGIRAVLTGDASLSRRPMKRVVEPLVAFGARIGSRDGLLPVETLGGKLEPFDYIIPVSSAQLKSALLCAALFVDGVSVITERERTRDHTERMLRLMGGAVEEEEYHPAAGTDLPQGGPGGSPPFSGGPSRGRVFRVTGRRELSPIDFAVPGDISSAVFFVAAALVSPNSELVVRNVLLNPTRSRILDLFREMGGDIDVNAREGSPEPAGDVVVRGSPLRGAKVGRSQIPLLIDEIPALAAAAFFAEGETEVRDAGELRVKESDRIRGIVEMVRGFGGEIEELPDGFVIRGSGPLAKPRPAVIESREDHRLAMAASILAINAEGSSIIRDAQCVDISFPGYFELLARTASV